ADQVDQIDGKFDVVIINSVIHCFPGLNYLRDVIRKIIDNCSNYATLFLGDLMDQDLKYELVKSFQDFKQQNQEKKCRTKTDWSRELFVSRHFLEDLQVDFPFISEIKFSNKIHTIENELTLFRYDAMLVIDKTKKTSRQSKHKDQHSLKDLQPYSESNLELKSSISHLAYVLFTSGTTGRPKGVMVEHRTLWKYINWAVEAYFHDTQEKPCFPFYSPLTFDLTVTSIFCPLLTGSYLRVFGGEFDDVLEGLIQYQDCNILKLTPTHLSMLLENNQPLKSIRKYILGGEALYSAAINSLHDLYETQVQIYNEYGPTEATVGCIVYENYENFLTEGIIPIGNPMTHVKIHLLNEALKPVPIGGVGEICIAGDCLARGYLNNKDMTSEKFVNDPFSQLTKMYKTGDLGRILPNGVIEYLGRNDRQVKIKGYRIELNEIESKLCKYPSINHSAVAVKEDTRGKVICAYYCGEPSLTSHDLKEFLQKELPEYMVPSYFIRMDEIPLSTNGKIDYLRLPDPFLERERKNCILARNENEKALVHLWANVLGLPQEDISIEDDFFDLGGDSIIAMRLLPKLSDLGMKLSIKEIFQYRTISAITHYAKNNSHHPTQVISQKPVSGNFELTPIQKWFFEIEMPHPEFFNMANLFRVSYDVDEDLLEEAFIGCIVHHDILRASFRFDGESLKQACLPPEEMTFKLLKQSLVGLDPNQQFLRMHAISDEVHGSFDLQRPPLVKAVLIDLGDNQKRLLIVVHHLVFDGVSWRYLVEDIESLYHSKLNTKLPLKTDSFKNWSETLANVAVKNELEMDYWLKIAPLKLQLIVENPGSKFLVSDYIQELVIINSNLKEKLFASVSKELNLNEILLSALFMSLSDEFNVDNLLINHEGHGRFGLNNVDVSRTIGWFTSIYPLLLTKQATVKQTLQFVCHALRSVNTIDLNYGIGRYLQKQPELQKIRPEVLFNYFGRVGADLLNNKKSLLTDCEQLNALTSHTLNKMPHSLEINAIATEEHVQVSFMYDAKSYSHDTMTKLLQKFPEKIEVILENISQQRDQA
nr:AMP-binding protein [Parachlamydiaceae bacterium]